LKIGILATKTLQILKISNIDLQKDALEALANGICENKSLKVLDLSYCAIKDKYSQYITRIILEQGELRDTQIW